MSTEEVARGAVGLPRGGPEESEGGPAAASAAAAEPLALADGWEDWPEEVWAEFRRGAEPLTWNRAQRIAGRVCREGSLRYGRESSERFRKFELVMSEAFGPGWRIRAQREEVFAKRRLELRRAETEAALEEEFGVAADPPGGRLGMEPAAGAPAGFAELLRCSPAVAHGRRPFGWLIRHLYAGRFSCAAAVRRSAVRRRVFGDLDTV